MLLCCQVNSRWHSECTAAVQNVISCSPNDTVPHPRWQHCRESLTSCSIIPFISNLNHFIKFVTPPPLAIQATMVSCYHANLFMILVIISKFIYVLHIYHINKQTVQHHSGHFCLSLICFIPTQVLYRTQTPSFNSST